MPRRPPKKARTASPLPSSAPSATPDDQQPSQVPQDSVKEDESGSQITRPMTDQEELSKPYS
ncbi:hypothetical protein PtA15_5A474 [Puccinia triticina]|uniref:Uncharacterized protein n=1 Tax=Puccinia triticina TaxID=208348 RepID=A0ABY7CI45_9BASI|nr:uncharacterized protein PtA15_5A474 [Puccinia triticina]WAQ84901.1 hypothetical protein PtA15_5A474 [Puccinia triticina]